MSFTTTRAELVTAINTVTGLKARPNVYESTTKGDVLIRWVSQDEPGRFSALDTWSVILICPQGLTDAEKYTDVMLQPLVTALASHCTITRAEPARVTFDQGGAVNVVAITCVREAG